jgi:cytochrome c
VTPIPSATPTIDRLAAPPTVENPNQADDGAQLFWLHCQPCHGDRGQGLTDEWRAQYPPEDQNCWEGGCHGKRPYENGFMLPESVPAVIGDGSLGKFETMGQVYTFISAAMPLQNPGHLSEEEYLAITAFLARSHGVGDGMSLDTTSVYEVRLKPLPAGATETLALSQNDQEKGTQPANNPIDSAPARQPIIVAVITISSLGLTLIVIVAAWRRRRRER